MSEPEKIATFQIVSNEVLAEAGNLWSTRMFGPDTRTPEQKAADEAAHAERMAEQERQRQAELDAHAARVAAAEGLRRAILELHAPQTRGWTTALVCDGCDYEGFEAEPPEFPCRTYDLAAANDG